MKISAVVAHGGSFAAQGGTGTQNWFDDASLPLIALQVDTMILPWHRLSVDRPSTALGLNREAYTSFE